MIGTAIYGCGSGGATPSSNLATNPPTNPATSNPPSIQILDPSCASAGGPGLSLFVGGSNVTPSSVVQWNGSDRPTRFDGGNNLSADISASDLAAPGTASITVFAPPPNGGTSNALSFIIPSGGVNPQSVTVDPSGKFVYVANYGCSLNADGNVSMYTTNSAGMLASIGPPVDAGENGSGAMAVDPSGKFAYTVNADGGDAGCGGSVSMFTINATTGALTLIGSILEDACAEAIAIHPSGKFAYVMLCSGDISMYSISGATGVLTSLGPLAVGSYPSSLAVDPAGKFVYVTAEDASSTANVFIYSVDSTTGTLTLVGVVATGANPSSVTVDPTDKFAYVANYGSSDVSMYSINSSTGNLTSIGTINAGSSPISAAVDPTGQFLYVVNSGSNNVSMYNINSTTGVLTPIGVVATGTSPSSIAIAPSGMTAYVTNSQSNTVSIYSINATTGVLALAGTINT
jgi:6-phosphogluconolactonase (cycloisomerase 2 family)